MLASFSDAVAAGHIDMEADQVENDETFKECT